MNQPQVPSHTPRWLPPTMWAIFTIILLVTLTLSFQTGTATKALEKPLVSQVTNTMTTLPSEEAILTITYYIRQIGRALLFFCSALPEAGQSTLPSAKLPPGTGSLEPFLCCL